MREGNQRVGPYSLIPGLLRELGADLDQVLRAAGLGPGVLNDMENRIPYLAIGRLLHECVVRTGAAFWGCSSVNAPVSRILVNRAKWCGTLQRYETLRKLLTPTTTSRV
jgi:hypothetical protein